MMETLRRLLVEARDKLNTADHLTYVTYPQIKEVKMLYAIMEDLNKVSNNVVKAIIQYERMYKRIPLVPNDFRSQFEVFRSKCANRYGFDTRIVEMVEDLNRIVELKRRSPMEFVRNDKFVLCTETYKMKVINLQKVKDYLQMSKIFVGRTSRILKC